MKEVIHFRQGEYDKVCQTEQKALAVIEELKSLAQEALGGKQVEDLRVFMEDPEQYILEKYYDHYGNSSAPHINKARFYANQIDIPLSRFKQLHEQYCALCRELGTNSLKISKTATKSTVNKESFKVFLDEQKRGHYEALKSFIEAAILLKEHYGATGWIKLIHYTPGLMYDDTGQGVTVNWNLFAANS